MSWIITIFIAIFTAAVGAVVSGYFANLAVSWYRISMVEGGAGYFVAMLALGGLVLGLLVGVIASRIISASGNPNSMMALLYSVLIVLGISGATGGTARLLADIPPTLDDESLMLQIEARWPNTRTDSPANTPGVAYLDLGSATTFRKQEPKRGALWKEDARRVDERWTVSGAAPLFTSRGTPVIDVALNDSERVRFTMPSLAHPTANDSAWSAWLPTEQKSGPDRTGGVTYRYRVEKFSAPVRTEIVGDFAVSAMVSYFMPVATEGLSTFDFYATFRIATSLGASSRVEASRSEASVIAAEHSNFDTSALGAALVALLPGDARPTLLAAVTSANDGSYWALVTHENGALHIERIAKYESVTPPAELTNIPERMAETRQPQSPQGRVDVSRYAKSKMLLFTGAVLNVETRTIHTFKAQSTTSPVPIVPPLGVSPDEKSFVRFAMGRPGNTGDFLPMLSVTDFINDSIYDLPINHSRMRYSELSDLNVEWLSHHFIWIRDTHGVDRLEVRTEFVPLPYRGKVLTDTNGQSSYMFTSGGQPARQALVEFLKADFHATGDTSNEDEHAWTLHIGPDSLDIATAGARESYMLLSHKGPASANSLVLRIAKAFNVALATGKYDKAFEQQ